METIDIQGVADKLQVKVSTVRGYQKVRVVVWHLKDPATKRKNLYYSRCIDIRGHFLETMINNGNTMQEIGGYFNEAFGAKDQTLISKLEENPDNGDVIEHFKKIFAEKKTL